MSETPYGLGALPSEQNINKMPEIMPFGLGANESTRDSRTVPFQTTMSALFDKGGYDYLPEDIENQWKVGICTAISLIQERQKANSQ